MKTPPTTLKDWFLSPTTAAAGRPVLLMDGGVSTHLERLLAEAAATTSEERGAFPLRELWSSSLLMSPEGRATILRGHGDWLAAGAEVLTTVTYQCHFGTGGA